MTTHRTEDLAAGDVTTWLRDEATGLVTNKVYADGMGPAYGYTPDGRPTRTTWARGAWFENVYDGQGRVVQVLHDDATLDAALEYDALGRPVARNADAFGYDALGQVVSARFGADEDPDLYAYDFIGNFTSNCLRNAWAQFEANELNEYVSITNHPNHPTHQNHPNHPNHLNLSYDSDGNLLTNGVWSYAYDSRNRLTTVWSNGVFVLENRYDHASRRVLKRTPSATHRYCYDGWNPVCEIVVSGDATNRIDYFWGKDLSGSLQGAGCVGGLLAVRAGGDSYYPAYDNNGNIVAYADSDCAVVASYAYDAFGNTLSASGPLASAFAHAFSTKPFDRETGLYYYGYRFYAPVLGRWMNRDPIGEQGGINIYSFVNNQPCFRFDYFGLRLIISPDSKIPVLDDKRRIIRLNGSGYLDKPTFESYIDTILVKVSYIIGDCIELKWREITDGFFQSAADFGTRRPNPVLITYVDKSESKPGCTCTPCFSVLKKLLEDSEKTITIMHTSITDNAWARGNTVLMNQEPKIKNRFLTQRGEKEMFTDLRFVFWHEVIAHAYLEKTHEESPMNVLGIPDNIFYDETIEEENRARECFRQFTGKDILAPERAHQYYPEGWTF